MPEVTADTALTVSAYWACVNTIADDLAAIPWKVFRKRPGGGREAADDHPLDWLLSTAPNAEQTAFRFRQAWVKNALTHGAGVAEVERDYAGRPAALWVLDPARVRPARDAGGLYYRVSNYGGRPDTRLEPDDAMVLVGMPDDTGTWGLSVLDFASRSLGTAMLADRHAARGFANDGRPAGVIEMEKPLTKEAARRMEDDWAREHAGKPGHVPVLEQGKFKPITPTSPQDAQLLASRQFSCSDIARFFKIPAHKIGDLSRSTNNNIEQQALEYVQGTLQPWAVRLEQAADAQFGRKQAASYYTKLNFGSLMRGDSAARSQYLTRMVTAGLMCPDDARDLEDLNPIPGGLGKTFFVPTNLQPIERAVHPPAPTPTPSSPAVAPPSDGGSPASPAATDAPAGDAPSPLAPVFREAAGRVLRREAHRATEAARRYGDDFVGLAAWEQTFLAEHRGYVVKAFAAAASAAGLAAAGADVVLAIEADEHCRGYPDRRMGMAADADPKVIAAFWEAAHAGPLAERVMANVLTAAKVYGA
jgi:HK97 family phage portal protein